ncbi:MAG: hypothetical protein ACM3N6_10100, partial [Betaproteobacteria bacterium]
TKCGLNEPAATSFGVQTSTYCRPAFETSNSNGGFSSISPRKASPVRPASLVRFHGRERQVALDIGLFAALLLAVAGVVIVRLTLASLGEPE